MLQKETKTVCYYVQNISNNNSGNSSKTMFYDKSLAEKHFKELKLVGIDSKLVAVEIATTTIITEKILMI